MADIGGVFNVLLTINDGDRVVSTITANAGVTWSAGAELLFAGNFSFFINGQFLSTATGKRNRLKSELANPLASAYTGLRFDAITSGSNFENFSIEHSTSIQWSNLGLADNLIFDNVILEKGRNHLTFTNTLPVTLGEVLKRNADSTRHFTCLMSGTGDVVIGRYADVRSGGGSGGGGTEYMNFNSNNKLTINELIMDAVNSTAPCFQRSGGSPTFDIGRAFLFGVQHDSWFFNWAASSGSLIGGGIIENGFGFISQFMLGAQNVWQNIDFYCRGNNDNHTQGPNEIGCAYHGFRLKSVTGFNFIADTGTPNGIQDVSTQPFQQDSIASVKVVDNYPEAPPVLVTATPGLESVSVDFTVRNPGKTMLYISDSADPLVVDKPGDLSQYSLVRTFGYDQLINLDGSGKTITSNIETGNRNLTTAVPGGKQLRARLVQEVYRTKELFFSPEFTFTPTSSGGLLVHPGMAGGMRG